MDIKKCSRRCCRFCLSVSFWFAASCLCLSACLPVLACLCLSMMVCRAFSACMELSRAASRSPRLSSRRTLAGLSSGALLGCAGLFMCTSRWLAACFCLEASMLAPDCRQLCAGTCLSARVLSPVRSALRVFRCRYLRSSEHMSSLKLTHARCACRHKCVVTHDFIYFMDVRFETHMLLAWFTRGLRITCFCSASGSISSQESSFPAITVASHKGRRPHMNARTVCALRNRTQLTLNVPTHAVIQICVIRV